MEIQKHHSLAWKPIWLIQWNNSLLAIILIVILKHVLFLFPVWPLVHTQRYNWELERFHLGRIWPLSTSFFSPGLYYAFFTQKYICLFVNVPLLILHCLSSLITFFIFSLYYQSIFIKQHIVIYIVNHFNGVGYEHSFLF